MSRCVLLCAPALWIALLAGPALAHDPGLSATRVVLSPTHVESWSRFHRADTSGWAPSEVPVEIRIDGKPLTPRVREVETTESHLSIQIEYGAALGHQLRIGVPLLAGLPLGHKHAVRVEDAEGRLLADGIVDLNRPFLEAQLEPTRLGPQRIGWAWFVQGVEHITSGWDHLLFLFALLIACPSLARASRVVSGFTAGHSLSLAAAGLGWLHAPPELIEPAIAGSIVVVSVLNLVGAGRPTERLLLTFAFGLVHGLGFAGFLAGLGIGGAGGGVALPLLAFNLGVEAGQLALVVVALPVLGHLARAPRRYRRLVRIGSTASAGLAAFWLVDRVIVAF